MSGAPGAVDVRYGPAPQQLARLRVPPGQPAPVPVVVVIHGGFWRSHYGREHMEPLAAALTAAGVATWSVGYRRVGEDGGGWPGTLEDVGTAIDRLRGEDALDPSRVVTLGFSAGGHLALWAAARHRLPEGPLRVRDPLPLRGAISLAGVCDLGPGSRTGVGSGAVDALLGGTPPEVPDRYAAADPAALVPLGVRQVLIHGTRDENVPIELSRSYAEKATAAGDAVELMELPGATHFDLIATSGPAWEAVREAVEALTS